MERIVLASQSPRRKQLLEWAEIEFDIIVPQTDESFSPGIAMDELAIHIAREKARSIQSELSHERIILAADTIVVLDKQVIGKPTDKTHAIEILQQLSGKKHQVITGVVILKGKKEVAFADTTDVTFHQISKDQIEFYVDKYKPYDKAGAYAIQEWIGVVGIKNISGDFYNVMGLPVSRVVRELQNLGLGGP
jgi:septum formation protein